jgi:hypothetical protein
MSTAPLETGGPDRIVTIQDIANFAASGKGTLEEVTDALSIPIDPYKFRQLCRYIAGVSTAKWTNESRRKKSEFISAQNRRKGKLFEELVGLVLSSCHAFQIFGNVQTLTNEIDWLVYLAPLSVLLPALSSWGTHFLCECKMSKGSFDGNWVTRLYALTQTHGTQVAVLFTAKELGNKGGSGKPLRAIQDYAITSNPAFIIRISMDELKDCVDAGKSPLLMLSSKYVELRARRARVGLLTA